MTKREEMYGRLISRYIRGLRRIANKNRPSMISNKGFFNFVPAEIDTVISLLQKGKCYLLNRPGSRRQANSIKFLDCGCGIGNVVAAADVMGMSATGIEIDADTVRLAEDLNLGEVVKDNILTYKHYNNYDFIYYYAPIAKYKLQMIFEKKVANAMRVGAIIVPLGRSNTFSKDKRFKQINRRNGKGNWAFDPIFVKRRK